MIERDLYPTVTTDPAGNEFTDSIRSIPITDPDFTNAYWLGWLAWEKMPTAYKISTLENDQENDRFEAKIVTVAENLDIGYVSKYVTSLPNIMYYRSPSIHKYNTETQQWTKISNLYGYSDIATNSSYLPNKVDINTAQNTGIDLIFTLTIQDTIDGNSSGQYLGYVFVDMQNIVMKIFEPTIYKSSITVQAGNPVPEGFELKIPWENMDGEVHRAEVGGKYVFYVLTNYYVDNCPRAIKPDGTGSGYLQNVALVRTHAEVDGNTFAYVIGSSEGTLSYPAETFLRGGGLNWFFNGGVAETSYDYRDNNNDYTFWFGGLEGSVTISDVNRISNNFKIWKPDGCNFVFVGTGRADACKLRRTYTLDDVYTHLALQARWERSDTVTYDNTEDIYYALVSPENEFTGEFVNGANTAMLKEWQLIGKSVEPETSDYDSKKDKPEYVPEEEEDGGPPDEGNRGYPIDAYNFGVIPDKSNFVHYVILSQAAAEELATNLWAKSKGFWDKIVTSVGVNPFDYLISLRYYPLLLTGVELKPKEIYLGKGGKINFANMIYDPAPVQLFDFGRISVKRQYNNFLDYMPYTNISIFLPYAGTFELNPTIIMGRTIGLSLLIDVTDGSGVWVVYNFTDNQPVLIKQCKVGADIPITGIDASQMASNMVNATMQTVQHAIGTASDYIGSRGQAAVSAISGGAEGGGQSIGGSLGHIAMQGPNAVLTGLSDAYNIAKSTKEIPQYTGGTSGLAAAAVNHLPYLIYKRPLSQNPSNYGHTVGRLVNQTHSISACSGYTVCRNVDVSGISNATSNERAQIKQIMESGFYA